MSFDFNAEEVFEIAEQIERNGAAFYRRAAQGTADSISRQFFLDLARMEDEHEKIFAAMKKRLSDQERESMAFDPGNEAALYLKAMVDSSVFDTKTDASKRLAGNEAADAVLRTAIRLEKDGISFYAGMREFVPERLGKARIDAILKEEMRHVTILSDRLASLRP